MLMFSPLFRFLYAFDDASASFRAALRRFRYAIDAGFAAFHCQALFTLSDRLC